VAGDLLISIRRRFSATIDNGPGFAFTFGFGGGKTLSI
jgi:hypothetical protein